MKNWYIYDNQVTETPGLDIAWLPATAYIYVRPHLQRTMLGIVDVHLEAGPYVGSLPLKNGDTLYIIPRVGRESYSRMLFIVEGIEDAVSYEFEEFARMGYEESGNAPWHVLLKRPFVSKLRQIEKASLVTSRVPTYRRLNYMRGRLKIADSLISLMRQEEYPVHTYLRETTILNLENRLLSTAAATILKMTTVNDAQRPLLARWASLSHGKFITIHELRQVSAGLKARKYTGSRSYYIPALIMAKLILSQSGLTLSDENSTASEPVMTNIADLFEKYIRTIIAKQFSPQGYLVEKRENKPVTLFIDGACELKPDVLLSLQGMTKLIVDIKYKPRSVIDTADYYQMNTYLENFGINTGLLVLPNAYQFSNSLIKHETVQGRKIFELRLSLDDWQQSENILSETVNQLI